MPRLYESVGATACADLRNSAGRISNMTLLVQQPVSRMICYAAFVHQRLLRLERNMGKSQSQSAQHGDLFCSSKSTAPYDEFAMVARKSLEADTDICATK